MGVQWFCVALRVPMWALRWAVRLHYVCQDDLEWLGIFFFSSGGHEAGALGVLLGQSSLGLVCQLRGPCVASLARLS